MSRVVLFAEVPQLYASIERAEDPSLRDRPVIVGGDPRAVRRLGFQPASTMQDALEMASDTVGSSPSITYLHNPPILMADVT